MEGTSALQQELADSTRQIAKLHGSIALGRELIGHLSEVGEDVTDAENLLRAMTDDLEAVQARRKQIVRELELAEVQAPDLTGVPPAPVVPKGVASAASHEPVPAS